MQNEKAVTLVSFLLRAKFLIESENEFIMKNFVNLKRLFMSWCQQISNLKGYLEYRNQKGLLSLQK
jgi:hypothetical protein